MCFTVSRNAIRDFFESGWFFGSTVTTVKNCDRNLRRIFSEISALLVWRFFKISSLTTKFPIYIPGIKVAATLYSIDTETDRRTDGRMMQSILLMFRWHNNVTSVVSYKMPHDGSEYTP